jgi:hypothetical protein
MKRGIKHGTTAPHAPEAENYLQIQGGGVDDGTAIFAIHNHLILIGSIC